jgi:hypothetical protein
VPGAFAPGGTGCVSPSFVYVLGFRAGELAELLDSSGVSVDSAPQRARAALDGRLPEEDRDRAPLPRSVRERALVGLFVDALDNPDVDGLLTPLTEDAWLTTPPEPLVYQGHMAIARFYRALPGWGGRGLRLVATRANGRPALGSHLGEPGSAVAHAYGFVVLTLRDDRTSAVTRFGDDGLLPCFGLPLTLSAWARVSRNRPMCP